MTIVCEILYKWSCLLVTGMQFSELVGTQLDKFKLCSGHSAQNFAEQMTKL